jgi:4-hydroxybenzoate polyprenyltransferase
MILGISATFLLSAEAGWLVAAYALVSIVYSAHLKKYVVLDVIVLAALYTSRLLAGGAAVGVELSFWLLAFSMFLFLSLAIVKRITELKTLAASGKASASGRGYEVADLRVVQALGIASGYISVLVFALYINAPEVKVLYPTHQALWAVCVALIYWIGRLWVKAERGEVHDDPLVWAITDRNSVALGLGVVAALIVATLRVEP